MKILLLSAATGGGHLRAAYAIEQYVNEHTPHEAVTVDALKAVGKLLDKTVCDSYLFMAKNTPTLFGKLYRQTNKDNPLSKLVPMLTGQFSSLLLKTIREHDPDAIVTTHPFAAEMVSTLKENGGVTAPLVSVITDYGPHKAYMADKVDAYLVACEDMVEEMRGYGVPVEKIHPFGIPVHEVFFRHGDKTALRQELELDQALPTVLFMAGSFGVSNIMGLYRSLADTDVPMQIVVITGRNRRLYSAFEEELASGNASIPTKLIYFTDKVEQYMHAADLLVTKPGGLTVSEALASDLPLAVFDAIPGQEEDNAAFLSAHGMGIRLGKGAHFAEDVSSLLRDPERLAAMKESCRAFDKSQSVPDLLELLNGLCAK